MKRRETTFSLLFRHWIRAHPPSVTTHYELKQTTENSIPFVAFESHQRDYCDAILSDKGVLMRNLGGNGEPDYSYLCKDPVFIAIKYPNEFLIISVRKFCIEKEISLRKSLTLERAREIADTVVNL